jgi:hypothetical protein
VRGGGLAARSASGTDGEEVIVSFDETIDNTIEGLIPRLAGASDRESIRIRTRIAELEALKEQHDTT